MSQSEVDALVCTKFINIKNSAESRGKVFDMTFEEVKRLCFEQYCFFSGKLLNNITNDLNSKTFDRLDNEKGYVNGNVVACSLEYNRLKKDLTIAQLKLIINGFKKGNLWVE